MKIIEGATYYVLDAGYKIPAIARQLIEDKKIPVMPYKRPMTKKGFFKKYEYVYDEYYDCYLCPNHQVLTYRTTNREGYREYKSDGKKCKDCPYQSQCTGSKDHVKVITRHVWENYMEQVEEIRHTKGIKEIYQQRKQTIERVACMNLKKMAIWKWRKKWGAKYNSLNTLFYRKMVFIIRDITAKWFQGIAPETILSTV